MKVLKSLNENKKTFVLILIIMSLLLLIVGCGKEDNVDKLTIGVMSDVGAIPFYMAKELGYFDELGLEVDVQVFKSAIDRDTELQTGNLDGAMADMLTIVFFEDAGFNVKMTSSTYGNYKLVTAPVYEEESFLALDQQSIGLSSNTVIDFATEKIAEDKDFSKTLNKLAIPQMPVRLEMLKAGELSGATLPEPLSSAATIDGGVIIGTTEDFELYPAIFIMSEEVLDNNAEGVRRFYKGYNKAVDYINNTDVKVYFDKLVEGLSFPEMLRDRFDMPIFEYITPPDESTYEITLEWMRKQGLTQNNYTYEELTDSQYLTE